MIRRLQLGSARRSQRGLGPTDGKSQSLYVLSHQPFLAHNLPMSKETHELEVTLQPDLRAPEQARRSLEVVQESLHSEVLDDVRLLVNELVTNSVKFAGRGSIELKLVTHDDSVRVEVHDAGPGFAPAESPPLLTDTSGRGLFLVDTLADRWGVTLEGTTCVWFEIDGAVGAA